MTVDQGNARGQFDYEILVAEFAKSARHLSAASSYFKLSGDQTIVSGQVNYGNCRFGVCMLGFIILNQRNISNRRQVTILVNCSME
jgi:hypothetical protein